MHHMKVLPLPAPFAVFDHPCRAELVGKGTHKNYTNIRHPNIMLTTTLKQ